MRTSILDWALMIGNLCCLYDHKQEERMNLKEELNTVVEIEEDPESLILDITWDMNTLEGETSKLLEERRWLQGVMFDIFDIDKEYWCQFKHWCTVITSLQELVDAHPNNQELRIRRDEMMKMFYNFLWTITWVGPANCWRCLMDKEL